MNVRYTLCFIGIILVRLITPEVSAKDNLIDYSQFEKYRNLRPVVRSGHSGSVNSVAFSPDGRYIASGSSDNTIKLWSIEGKRLIKTFEGHSGSVNSVAFSPDSRYIASGASDKTIRLWPLEGNIVKTLEGHSGGVSSVSFSPDGRYIVSGSSDKKIKVWSVNGNLIRTLDGHSEYVRSVALSPDGRYIASASGDYKMKLWSINGNLIKTIEGKSGYSSSAAFSPDSRYLAAASSDNTITLWSIGGNLAKTFKDKSNSSVDSVSFSPDGKFILAGCYDNMLRLWSIDGTLVKTFGGHSGSVRSVAFSRNGKYMASGSEDKTIELWSAEGRLIEIFRAGYNNTSVAFSPDGKYITTGSDDNTVKLWTINGKLARIFEGHSGSVLGVAFSSDSKNIFSCSEDNTIKVWSLDGNLVRTINGNPDYANAGIGGIALSPNGKFIAATYCDHGTKYNETNLWSIEGKIIKSFKQSLSKTLCVSFSHDGKYIILGTDSNSLKLWTTDGNYVRTFFGDKAEDGNGIEVNSVVFSQDDKFIISSFDNKIKVWSIDGNLIKTVNGHAYEITSLAISIDGKYIVSGASDNTAKLWSIDGILIRTFKGHADKVTGITLGLDNKYLLTSSSDGSIKLWNIQSGKSVGLLISDDGRWFNFDNSGHFDCEPESRNSILFIKGLTVYQTDQFWDKFYTPGLMAKFMSGEDLLDVDIDKAAKDAPVVTINPNKELRTDKACITIRVSASGEGGVGRILLYQNGRPLDEKSRGITVKQSRQFREFIVDLVDGENQFVGAAYDKSGSVEGRSERLFVIYNPREIVKPDIYILAAGVSNYKDSNIRLISPNADARAISETLKDISSKLYRNVNITVLTDMDASKANIDRAIDDIAKKCRLSDTVILFFAGHGDTEKNLYYYLPFDADITSLTRSGVCISDLSNYVQKIRANKVALFLDTCKSGSAVKDIGKIALARGFDERKMIANLAKSRGIAVFSAANEGQSAYEIKDLGHGIFTWCVIDAIRNRRREISIDGAITMSKLLGVVNQMTRETADKYLKIEQSPVLYFFGDDFIIGK